MTFYQELQVNQAGSKKIIRESASQREKLYHIAVYLTKIAITVAFCFVFVSLYSLGFGADNSIVGVVVLLYLLVFRSAHLCIRTGQSTLLLAGFFGIMAVGPHAANLAGPVGGLFINAAAIALLILFGCHEPRMFNQSTLVLGYLLLFGSTGLGKTFLSTCIAEAVSARGFSVAYDTAINIVAAYETIKFGSGDGEAAAERAARYERADLLIIDDMGTEMGTAFTVSALYNLINNRLMAKRPMIINTNLLPETLSEKYSPAVASRLLGEFLPLRFFGDDIRLLKMRRT